MTTKSSTPSMRAVWLAPPRWRVTWLDGPIAVFSLDRKKTGVAPDFESLLSIFEDSLEQERPGGVVLDLEGAQPDAKKRMRLAQWIEQEKHRLSHFVRCAAVVVPSAFERGVFTAVLWLIKNPIPTHAFESKAEALSWVQSFLQANRVNGLSRAKTGIG